MTARSRVAAAAGVALLLGGCGEPNPSGTVEFAAADGVRVVAEAYPADEAAPSGPRSAAILLFHQGGGDARGEYERIVPRLGRLGFDALAVDLRRGGDRFGGVNRTLAGVDPDTISYCDTAVDIAAAVDFARTAFGGRDLVLWGSSFSATMVLREAARRPHGIAGVLSFSPAGGEPMEACQPEEAVAALQIPIMILRPASELELDHVAAQAARFDSLGHAVFVADPARHGSSMLDSTRVGAPVDSTWTAVTRFLEGVVSR